MMRFLLAALLALQCVAVQAAGFDHSIWDSCLDGAAIHVSRIFKWYRRDFEKSWRGAKSLPSFLLLYRRSLGLTDAATAALVSDSLAIEYLDYDWRLNSTVTKTQPVTILRTFAPLRSPFNFALTTQFHLQRPCGV